ncbi:MAG: hypothetical protein HYY76_13620 [Acidobacteria bacterium]|nr:hypothetical protein [Acidobacteriota bacterium]
MYRQNEYILVNASRAGSTAASAIDCSTASGGEAYELSGTAEADLEPFVGRMVEIGGTLKHAGADNVVVGTTGTTRALPSGGFDPLGQDLQLHEIDVTSFREVTAQAQVTSQAEPEARAPEQQETQPVGTTGAADLEPFVGRMVEISKGRATAADREPAAAGRTRRPAVTHRRARPAPAATQLGGSW